MTTLHGEEEHEPNIVKLIIIYCQLNLNVTKFVVLKSSVNSTEQDVIF